jgi:hypothetical protein
VKCEVARSSPSCTETKNLANYSMVSRPEKKGSVDMEVCNYSSIQYQVDYSEKDFSIEVDSFLLLYLCIKHRTFYGGVGIALAPFQHRK